MTAATYTAYSYLPAGDGTACVTGNAPWRWNDIITDLGMRQADLAHAEGFTVVRTLADIDAAHRAGDVLGGNVYRALQAIW